MKKISRINNNTPVTIAAMSIHHQLFCVGGEMGPSNGGMAASIIK